ncbi:uncharacterized protein N0V89_003901 [Didymosphaeria variabile]|uniref:Uncharacterized protein n=1 Tax=Didymosphaeria variabile TaxID=1932322 RepID=A0A9W8XR50_9PLEO|nr:uncharacterized protein N0V89_003901 [Didymosphaeria variabile]KAJ4355878.1 hypothetical protein N0V89_003901 [Didymosphaeria variabile]
MAAGGLSKPEYDNERLLLPVGDAEALQYRDREEQNDNVLRNVDGGVRKPNSFLVQALSVGDSFVPEEFDREAEKDTPHQCPKSIQYNETHDDKACSPKSRDWKYPHVLRQNRNLRGRQRKVVDPDTSPESLSILSASDDRIRATSLPSRSPSS